MAVASRKLAIVCVTVAIYLFLGVFLYRVFDSAIKEMIERKQSNRVGTIGSSLSESNVAEEQIFTTTPKTIAATTFVPFSSAPATTLEDAAAAILHWTARYSHEPLPTLTPIDTTPPPRERELLLIDDRASRSPRAQVSKIIVRVAVTMTIDELKLLVQNQWQIFKPHQELFYFNLSHPLGQYPGNVLKENKIRLDDNKMLVRSIRRDADVYVTVVGRLIEVTVGGGSRYTFGVSASTTVDDIKWKLVGLLDVESRNISLWHGEKALNPTDRLASLSSDINELVLRQ